MPVNGKSYSAFLQMNKRLLELEGAKARLKVLEGKHHHHHHATPSSSSAAASSTSSSATKTSSASASSGMSKPPRNLPSTQQESKGNLKVGEDNYVRYGNGTGGSNGHGKNENRYT